VVFLTTEVVPDESWGYRDQRATLGVWFKGRQPPTSSVIYADSKFTLEVSGCRCSTSSGHEGISLKHFVISSFIMSYETLSFPENPQVLKSYLAPIPY